MDDSARTLGRGEEEHRWADNEHPDSTRAGQALPARTDRDVRARVSRAPTVVCRRPRAGDDSRPGGFSDAGHAIKLAARHLKDTLDTELVASFAIDELLDYRSRRPLMTFKTDHFTHYDDPELNLYALHDSVGTPFLLLAGMEPDLKWERFITAVRLLAERLGVRQIIGLGTIPMAVPHTRPVTMTAHANDRELIADSAVGRRGAGARQRVQPARVPDGPARSRGRRVHRPRPALPGADGLSGGRRGVAGPGRQDRFA